MTATHFSERIVAARQQVQEVMLRFEGPIQADLYAEVALSLARQSERLRKALQQLRQHDVRTANDIDDREELVDEAAERLWSYVVQRELLGLTDAEYIRDEFCVPREVWLKMGPRIRRERT